MANLKELFDNAKAASDDLARLTNEIKTLYNSGSEEDLAKAVELSDSLDAATKKANDLNKLYLSMRDADQQQADAASLFVNDEGTPEEPEAADKNELTRAEFNNLTPSERIAFAKRGGKLTE